MNIYPNCLTNLCLLFYLILSLAAPCRAALPCRDIDPVSYPYPVRAMLKKAARAAYDIYTSLLALRVTVQSRMKRIAYFDLAQLDSISAVKQQYHHIQIAISKTWYRSGWTLFFISLSFLFSFWSVAELWAYHRRRQRLRFERIDNLKHAMHLLNNAKKDLEQKLRLQTHLLASIAHDIRTPLGFISSAAKDAADQLGSSQSDRARKTNELIAYTSDEMVQMVENLITFMKTRIYGGGIQLKKVNLRRIVQENIGILTKINAQQKGMLTIDIEPDIFVNTNPSLLGVIIHNLVDNAVKIKSSNQINIFCLRQAGMVHLVIGDQGPGMPAALINWLSGTDSRESIVNDSGQGSGLGLIIVREISQMLGISIRVENLPGAFVYLTFDL